MPGTPPTSPRLGIPRYANTDAADFATDVNAVVDAVDASMTLVTTLPGSPRDGQMVWFLADASDDVQWDLRYRTASTSAYKWTFRGGPAAIKQDLSPHSATSLLANTVQAINTANNFTLPFAGDYDVFISGSLLVTSASACNVIAGVTAVAAPTSNLGFGASNRSDNAAGTQYVALDSGLIRIRGASAGTQITPALSFNIASVAYTTGIVFMTVTPVRVG